MSSHIFTGIVIHSRP